MVKGILAHVTFILSFDPANLSLVAVSLFVFDATLFVVSCAYIVVSRFKLKRFSQLLCNEIKLDYNHGTIGDQSHSSSERPPVIVDTEMMMMSQSQVDTEEVTTQQIEEVPCHTTYT